MEALVPWADFANHDCASGVFLDWDPKAAAVVLQASLSGGQWARVIVYVCVCVGA